MGEVVNLRRARKARARAADADVAAVNRVQHGRRKGERQATERDTERVEARHEGHRLDPPE